MRTNTEYDQHNTPAVKFLKLKTDIIMKTKTTLIRTILLIDRKSVV